MLSRTFLLVLLTASGFFGCKQRPATNQTESASPPTAPRGRGRVKLDVAKLLTSAEIQAVTGEPLKETTPSTRLEGGFCVSQCYFALATPSKSVVVTVSARESDTTGRDPRQFWMEKFHPDQEKENRGPEPDEDRPKQAPPEKVEGVGDEAYWVESGSTGALYILQGNTFVRLALGGTDEKAARIAKAKKLAQSALKRL